MVDRRRARDHHPDLGGEVSDRADWWDEVGERPVPLGAPEQTQTPVEDPIGVAEEAERYLESLTSPTEAPVADEDPEATFDQDLKGTSVPPRRVVAAFVLAACLAAFAHGWHTGSKRSDLGAQPSTASVTEFIPQDAGAR